MLLKPSSGCAASLVNQQRLHGSRCLPAHFAVADIGSKNMKHFPCCRRVFNFNFWKVCPISRVDHPEGPPTPQTPFQCPHPDKKGTILLLLEFCVHLHTHQYLKLKCCIVMGQKLRYGRSCTHNPSGTHNWLAQSHIASIS